MATNQEALHASVCAFLGTTPGTYESDWSALFTSAGFTTGDFNGRMLRWLNQQMGTSFTNLPGAQSAFADLFGAANWSALGSITDSEATAFFVRSGTLTPGRKALINTFMAGVKADLGLATLATGFDCLWLLANETSAAGYENLAKDDHHCTEAGTGTFTADQGYAGNGTTGFLETDYVPSTDLVSWSMDAVHAAVYVRTARTGNENMMSVSSRLATPTAIELAPRLGGNTILRANDNGTGSVTPAQGSTSGFWLVNRSTAAAVQKYRNQTTLTATTDASVAVPSAEMYIGARNTAGVASLFSTDQHAFASIGKVLTAANVASLQLRVEAYMDAIGAGVF
jgi:hypothetical protein